jgi:WD40 repeat protein
VAWSPDATKLATGSWDKTVQLWNTNTYKSESRLKGHSSYVTSVAWNNDGTKLASGSYDKTVRIWAVGSAGTFECESKLTVDSQVTSVAVCPDGSKIAASHSNMIQLFDAQTQAKLGSPLNGHTGSVRSVCFDHTGEKLASGGGYGDKSVRLWSTEIGALGSPLNGHSDWQDFCFLV